MTIMIASAKDGGSNSERDLMRACHLSGQIDADRAFAHYRDGELPMPSKKQPTDWQAKTLTAALVVFVWLVLAVIFVR